MNELFYSALKRGYRMNKPTHACDQVYAKTLSLACQRLRHLDKDVTYFYFLYFCTLYFFLKLAITFLGKNANAVYVCLSLKSIHRE